MMKMIREFFAGLRSKYRDLQNGFKISYTIYLQILRGLL